MKIEIFDTYNLISLCTMPIICAGIMPNVYIACPQE